METCENCGRSIGRLETPHVIEDSVVCAQCHAQVRASRAPAKPTAPPPAAVIVEDRPLPSRPHQSSVRRIYDDTPARHHVLHAPAPPPQIVNTVVVNASSSTAGGCGPALLSLLIPGLGQMVKGQPLNGLAWFVLTLAGYVAFIVPGLVLHVCCIIGAAMPTRVR